MEINLAYYSFSPIFPELILVVLLLSSLTFSVYFIDNFLYKNIAVGSAINNLKQLILVLILVNFFVSFEPCCSFYSNSLLTQNYSNLLRCITFFFVFILSFSSFNYLKTKKLREVEYVFFTLFSVIGSILLIIANDTLTIFLSIELQSLSFYLLSTYNLHSNFSAEAGLKYFILGSFASFLILFGFSIIYISTGLFSLQAIKEIINLVQHNFNLISLGFIFCITGLAFKIGAVPFHL